MVNDTINMTDTFCEHCNAELTVCELNDCLAETIICSDCEAYAEWMDSGEVIK